MVLNTEPPRHGELPSHEQLAAQNRAERAQRRLDPVIAASLGAQPLTAHPMDTLRTAVSLIGAGDPVENHNSAVAIQAKSLRLFAVLPAVVAADQRRRHGLGAITPREDLSYAANFLYLTFGKVPEPQVVRAFETSLILNAEHSFNASTFTARVVSSTHSDVYSAVAAAIGALKGPLHGGANEAVMEMLNEIGIPGLHPNLDYPTGPAYHLIGFDTPTFTPILVAARLPGWTAHIAEQLAANSVIRPRAAYDGPAERHLVQE